MSLRDKKLILKNKLRKTMPEWSKRLYRFLRAFIRRISSRIKKGGRGVINFCRICAGLMLRIKIGRKLPGIKFDRFGRKLAFRFLLRKDVKTFADLFCTPVNITRYFEFPFAYSCVDWEKTTRALDISSPRLFMEYALSQNPDLNYDLINPDIGDLETTRRHLGVLGHLNRAHLSSCSAEHLPYPDNNFDLVTSLSVIEHIPGDGDTLAVKEMWRVLKPGGKLVLTFPCSAKHSDEFRSSDTYGLRTTQREGQYFFQRFYDESSIDTRLIAGVGRKPMVESVFGEKERGIFYAYEKRWLENGITETAHDAAHIAKHYSVFENISSLPGMGVCGLCFEKS